jgi:plasmid stabilization system protein ParE
MRYEFHPDTLEELRQAAEYYAAREAGLGLRFIDSIEETIERILEAPTRWRVIEDEFAAALHTFFLTGSSTQSNKTSFLSSRSCTAVASRVTGGTAQVNAKRNS